jgi:hypothetical protein
MLDRFDTVFPRATFSGDIIPNDKERKKVLLEAAPLNLNACASRMSVRPERPPHRSISRRGSRPPACPWRTAPRSRGSCRRPTRGPA